MGSVLLALRMKYARRNTDIDSYHQYLNDVTLGNFLVTFNLDNGSSNKNRWRRLYII